MLASQGLIRMTAGQGIFAYSSHGRAPEGALNAPAIPLHEPSVMGGMGQDPFLKLKLMHGCAWKEPKASACLLLVVVMVVVVVRA